MSALLRIAICNERWQSELQNVARNVVSIRRERAMIHNDDELVATEEQILKFARILDELRATAMPEEFAAVSAHYQSEIEKMQDAVREYVERKAKSP